MRLLHAKDLSGGPFMDALVARIERGSLDVELAPLGSGPAEALVVGMRLSEEDFRTAAQAGVRWIQALPVGVENVLSPALARSDVVLTNGSGTSAGPMSEFAFARILEHAKKLKMISELVASRTWKQQWLGSLVGATITIVGLGPTGRAVARLARAFEMHLIAVRRRPEVGPGPCDEVVPPAKLTEVLPRTDYLVLAPALTPETRGMIGARELDAMKEGSLLVNIGRGELIDEAALLAALPSGRFTAALDVVAREPLPLDSPLWEAPGLLLSPHSSSFTESLIPDLCDLVVDNAERFMKGLPLRNVVDKASGYPLPGPEPASRSPSRP